MVVQIMGKHREPGPIGEPADPKTGRRPISQKYIGQRIPQEVRDKIEKKGGK